MLAEETRRAAVFASGAARAGSRASRLACLITVHSSRTRRTKCSPLAVLVAAVRARDARALMARPLGGAVLARVAQRAVVRARGSHCVGPAPEATIAAFLLRRESPCRIELAGRARRAHGWDRGVYAGSPHALGTSSRFTNSLPRLILVLGSARAQHTRIHRRLTVARTRLALFALSAARKIGPRGVGAPPTDGALKTRLGAHNSVAWIKCADRAGLAGDRRRFEVAARVARERTCASVVFLVGLQTGSARFTGALARFFLVEVFCLAFLATEVSRLRFFTRRAGGATGNCLFPRFVVRLSCWAALAGLRSRLVIVSSRRAAVAAFRITRGRKITRFTRGGTVCLFVIDPTRHGRSAVAGLAHTSAFFFGVPTDQAVQTLRFSRRSKSTCDAVDAESLTIVSACGRARVAGLATVFLLPR